MKNEEIRVCYKQTEQKLTPNINLVINQLRDVLCNYEKKFHNFIPTEFNDVTTWSPS